MRIGFSGRDINRGNVKSIYWNVKSNKFAMVDLPGEEWHYDGCSCDEFESFTEVIRCANGDIAGFGRKRLRYMTFADDDGSLCDWITNEESLRDTLHQFECFEFSEDVFEILLDMMGFGGSKSCTNSPPLKKQRVE